MPEYSQTLVKTHSNPVSEFAKHPSLYRVQAWVKVRGAHPTRHRLAALAYAPAEGVIGVAGDLGPAPKPDGICNPVRKVL